MKIFTTVVILALILVVATVINIAVKIVWKIIVTVVITISKLIYVARVLVTFVTMDVILRASKFLTKVRGCPYITLSMIMGYGSGKR